MQQPLLIKQLTEKKKKTKIFPINKMIQSKIFILFWKIPDTPATVVHTGQVWQLAVLYLCFPSLQCRDRVSVPTVCQALVQALGRQQQKGQRSHITMGLLL